ncbi:uncharacterized protein C5orf49 homolog [Cheilinus undulatus]|uniref:uncharacterized protein C5orf49 homolog n=1 Tax=Cheilinus undulatus TaxID=241271 RepID=UPI001BD66560|nr:uncharacterized protein C5orf49 homolog [Cheilinus undulatus]
MDESLEAQLKQLSTDTSFTQPRRKETSYFNRDPKAPEISTYDQVFHQAEGYDMKLRRDDRKHDKGRGLDINGEEKSRVVPVRSSAEYGHHPVPALFQTSRRHNRVASTRAEFYMKNGIIWNVEEGYGSVAPI